MDRENLIVGFDSNTLGYGKVRLGNPHKSGIPRGVTVIAGENGSGKTTLANILEKGRYAYGNRLSFFPSDLRVKMIAFSDIHSLSGMEVTYYNQRMEATMNDYVPTVAEIMARRKAPEGWMEKCREIGLGEVAEKKVNYLSSGELRKLLIVNALLSELDLLVLDNPYIGLDAPSRSELDESLVRLREKGVSTVMLLCDEEDIPSFTDNVIILRELEISLPITFEEWREETSRRSSEGEEEEVVVLPSGLSLNSPVDFKTAFEIRNGKVVYGDRVIFSGLDWRVGAGECWALQGRNGSGKSLLLSLICADNPQAYSNDITLFDRSRGSGESIFEIKDRIGFVSPEMQLYFKSADPVKEIVVQGRRNSLNRYRPSTPEEHKEGDDWLDLLGIVHLAERHFSELSSGEQRLVLLARAFIKRPALLILDEPFHGLDRRRKRRLRRLIDEIVSTSGSSLIFVSHYDEEIPDCVSRFYRLGE